MSDNGVATITVADTLIEASMSKVSPNGGALTGAVFEISGTFVDGGAPRLITFDETNTVPLEGLVVVVRRTPFARPRHLMGTT